MFKWLIGERKQKFVIEEMSDGLYRARVRGPLNRLFGNCLSLVCTEAYRSWLDQKMGLRVTGTLREVEAAVQEHYYEISQRKLKKRVKRRVKNV